VTDRELYEAIGPGSEHYALLGPHSDLDTDDRRPRTAWARGLVASEVDVDREHHAPPETVAYRGGSS
jgi:hypothetical protein